MSVAIKEAVSIDKALQTLEKFNPDIVISDINLPDGNGCSLIGQIKNMFTKNKNIKGVAITAIVEDKYQDKLEFLKAGFEEYLSKPFELDDLIRVVANMAAINYN